MARDAVAWLVLSLSFNGQEGIGGGLMQTGALGTEAPKWEVLRRLIGAEELSTLIR
jgi:hypothetical protein